MLYRFFRIILDMLKWSCYFVLHYLFFYNLLGIIDKQNEKLEGKNFKEIKILS